MLENIKSKWKWVILLFIIIVVIYLVYRYYNRIEKFQDNEGAILASDPFYNLAVYENETVFKGKYIGVVYLDFIYKKNPECTITRQFLSGCCKQIKNTEFKGDDIEDILLVGNESIYKPNDFTDYEIDGLPKHKTAKIVKEQLKNDDGSIKIEKVYKGMKYMNGNTCAPVNYYANELCNLNKESTLYHLKKVFQSINDKYQENILEKVSGPFDYADEYGPVTTSEDVDSYGGILGLKSTNLDNLYKFKLVVRLRPDSNQQEATYPIIKLRIPKEMDNDLNIINYDTRVYNKNINNVDQIMEFIYQNVVINYDVITQEISNSEGNVEKLRLILFDSYYQESTSKLDLTQLKSSFEVSKLRLYNSPRIITFRQKFNFESATKSSISNSQGIDKYKSNFIKYHYNNYKADKSINTNDNLKPFFTYPKLYFLTDITKNRNMAMMNKLETNLDYLTNRPKLFWEDIYSFKTDNFEDYSHLLILLEDSKLQEYYFDSDNKQNLIYWFAWNISKTDISLIEKNQENLKDKEPFSQLYPYQLISNKDNSFFVETQITNNRDIIKNGTKFLRYLNLNVRVVPITENENNELQNLYDNYQDKNYLNPQLFYRDFIKTVNKFTKNDKLITDADAETTTEIKQQRMVDVPYLMDNLKEKNAFENYYKGSYKNKFLTAFNCGHIMYDLEENNQTLVSLPHLLQYDIMVINNKNPPVTDIILTIDDELEFSPVEKNFIFKMPYVANFIKIRSNKKISILIRPNLNHTQNFIWEKFKSIKNTVEIKLSKPSKFLIQFKENNVDLSTDENLNAIKKDEDLDNIIIYKKQITDTTTNKTTNYYNIYYENIQQRDKNNIKTMNTKPSDKTIILKNINFDNFSNGTITFFQDDFTITGYQEEQNTLIDKAGPYRLNNQELTHKIKCSTPDSIASHQILPTIKWNTDLINIDIRYAIKAYYVKPDQTEKVVYLAWDLKDTEHQYRVFPSYRNTYVDNKLKRQYGARPSLFEDNRRLPENPAPQASPDEDIYESRTFRNIDGRECELLKDEDQSFLDKDSKKIKLSLHSFEDKAPNEYDLVENEVVYKDRNNKEQKIKVEGSLFEKIRAGILNKKHLEIINGEPRVKFNANGRRIEKLRNKIFSSVNESPYHYKTTDDPESSLELIYNKNISIWQIFRNENEILSWVGNQTKPNNPMVTNTYWMLSPEYSAEDYSGRYDFFDYPNEFDKDKEIAPHLLDYTTTIQFKFETVDSYSSNPYQLDCNSNKGNININNPNHIKHDCEKVKNMHNNRRIFNSTLFNLPNISERDANEKLVNIDLNKIEVDRNANSDDNLYYPMDIKVEVIPYISNGKADDTRNISDLVLKQYLNPKIIGNLNRALSNAINDIADLSTCKSDAIKKYYLEIQDEILTQRGNLDQVLFSDIFKKITGVNIDNFRSLDNRSLRNYKIIMENNEITEELLEAFNTYTSNRVHPDNFYSYGDIQLKQNQTIITYQVSVNKSCFTLDTTRSLKLLDRTDSNILFKIQKSKFYGSFKHIKFLKELYNETYQDNLIQDGDSGVLPVSDKCQYFDKDIIDNYPFSKDIISYLEETNLLRDNIIEDIPEDTDESATENQNNNTTEGNTNDNGNNEVNNLKEKRKVNNINTLNFNLIRKMLELDFTSFIFEESGSKLPCYNTNGNSMETPSSDPMRQQLQDPMTAQTQTTMEPISQFPMGAPSQTTMEPPSQSPMGTQLLTTVRPPSQTNMGPQSPTPMEPPSQTNMGPQSQDINGAQSQSPVKTQSQSPMESQLQTTMESQLQTTIRPQSQTQTTMEPPSQTTMEPQRQTTMEPQSPIPMEPESLTKIDAPAPAPNGAPSPALNDADAIALSPEVIEQNSKYLRIFAKTMPILKLYEIIETKIYGDDYAIIMNEILRNRKTSKEAIDLITNLNSKLALYNTFVADLYTNLFEKEPPEIKKIKKKSTTQNELIGDSNKNIFTFYQDMIFSIFDKD